MESETLYHIALIKTNGHGIEDFDIQGTYTDFTKAKAAARDALSEAGYCTESFPVLEIRNDREDWIYGADTFVHAETAGGTALTVAIKPTLNHQKLKGDRDTCRICGNLFYVLQQTVSYDIDSSGNTADMHVDCTCTKYAKAKESALSCLTDRTINMDDFHSLIQYPASEEDAYSNNPILYAVGANGRHYLVSVLGKRQWLQI
ncbi:hypothetical protein CC78DRAFT_576255 [Lojkania enalia]|uniref:Uncharacterized protein n=1 Tax=Lojkania enalia TaxID=147567 RepID=A0A9P4KGP6_9PLEO|nr:hypothetical protein CC78DRAFT_576255 [Didymosphaeria enalia]